jgi:hypothetical protein
VCVQEPFVYLLSAACVVIRNNMDSKKFNPISDIMSDSDIRDSCIRFSPKLFMTDIGLNVHYCLFWEDESKPLISSLQSYSISESVVQACFFFDIRNFSKIFYFLKFFMKVYIASSLLQKMNIVT